MLKGNYSPRPYSVSHFYDGPIPRSFLGWVHSSIENLAAMTADGTAFTNSLGVVVPVVMTTKPHTTAPFSPGPDHLATRIFCCGSTERQPKEFRKPQVLLALNTLGIHSKRPRLISIAQQILESLDVKICPGVKLLRVASMAELAQTKSDWRTVQKLQRRANELIMKVDPADHWDVRGVFEYLRLAASPGKQYVSG